MSNKKRFLILLYTILLAGCKEKNLLENDKMICGFKDLPPKVKEVFVNIFSQ